MIQTKYTLNVDTMVVTDTLVILNIGDTIEVISNAAPINCGTTDEPEWYVPLSWSLGQSPAGGAGTECLEIIGEDPKKGTMTFKGVGLGWGYIKYDVTDGPDAGKSKMIKLQIVD